MAKSLNLKKGDTVMMHTCIEARKREFKEKVWVCSSDSYIAPSGHEMVFLEGFSGSFWTNYLNVVPQEEEVDHV